ncbi:DUF1028 domain-containing protein [Pseudactinotalea terrae]|uniref:DUF1028 domain-containing protein n=1 Tax=Pseudactinotalea terrae TaxID=1743262 RepID=UPI0012E2DAF3|nr:DUF1028 domain-containing protein [Pseudactinotalea terrae]
MTFTLLAADPRTGLLGAAAASRSLAVGNAVISIDPGVGVVASQAWTNRALRARMLDALATGERPSRVVERVTEWDQEAERRQVAAMLPTGEADTRTGTETTDWAGAIVRPGVVVLGNLLTGSDVLQAVADTFEAGAADVSDDAGTIGHLARRMVAAMLAGEAAGGDRRGRQSAAVLVARAREGRVFPPELDIDLRVDDDEAPLHRLAALVDAQLRARGEG